MTLLEELIVETGLGRYEIERIAATAPKRYKHYSIPKKSGGERPIAQPARELKALQYFLIERVLSVFPVHERAAAYAVGRSIEKNARQHIHSRVILKLDFKEFFTSIKARDWSRFVTAQTETVLVRAGLVTVGDRALAVRLLFWGQGTYSPKCLSIGAPSSPLLSNLLLFEFDAEIAAICDDLNVRYSRYADDITLSGRTSSQLVSAEQVIRKVVSRLGSPRLTFNDDKRGLFTSGQRRMVTGLILTPDHKVSIGRGRKRAIKALMDKFGRGVLSGEDVGYLKGMLGFANAAEPEFLSRLRSKYGSETLGRALKLRLPKRPR